MGSQFVKAQEIVTTEVGKKAIQELRKRLDVAERILDQDGKLVDSLSDETPEVSEDIVEQVLHYFGVSGGSATTRASL